MSVRGRVWREGTLHVSWVETTTGEFIPWLKLVLGGARLVCDCGSGEPIRNTCRLGDGVEPTALQKEHDQSSFLDGSSSAGS